MAEFLTTIGKACDASVVCIGLDDQQFLSPLVWCKCIGMLAFLHYDSLLFLCYHCLSWQLVDVKEICLLDCWFFLSLKFSM